MVSFPIHCQRILGNIKNASVRETFETLLNRMYMQSSSSSSTQIWTLSEDSNEYACFRSLLDGSLKNSLDPEASNAALLATSVSGITFSKCLYVIHDGCNILKPESKLAPNACKVRDLEGKLVNGYITFNTVCVDEVEKKIHLLSCQVYSTNASGGFNQPIVGFTERELMEEQIRKVDVALKEAFPSVQLIHLLDRKHDDQHLFSFLSALGSSFVIRAKLNRNSNETILVETTDGTEVEVEIEVEGKGKGKGKKIEKVKEKPVKLVNATLTSKKTEALEKFVWKDKVYKNATVVSHYGTLTLQDRTYSVVKMQVYDQTGRKIFAEPMLLITNIAVHDHETAWQVYRHYLIRSKIEGVFKFLKQELGWQDFQLRDFLAIQNIIVLCFFVGSYFYETKKDLSTDENVAIFCKLAKSKGKHTPHFYKKGLAIVANYILFQDFIQENNLSQEQVNDLIEHMKQNK
jgi:hypothetical protein